MNDDISIADFLPFISGWNPPQIQSQDFDFIKEQMKRADKQVAHLTKSRLPFKNPIWDWDFDRINQILIPYWRAFELAINSAFPELKLNKIPQPKPAPQMNSFGMGATFTMNSSSGQVFSWSSDGKTILS